MHLMDKHRFLCYLYRALLAFTVLFAAVFCDGPKFRKPVFSGSVQENWPKGTKVIGLNVHLNRINTEPWCSNVPGRKWHLQLIGEERSHFELYFHHRYAQLSLKTTQMLDREKRSKYVFMLGLCCKHCLFEDNIVAELALVTVHVLDVNDNAPRFYPTSVSSSKISLDETTRLKSEVYRVSAYDPDLGTNADLVYYADPKNKYFFVIPKTGQVVLVESILNVKKPINLTIFARDHGQPPLLSEPLEVEICPKVKKFHLTGNGDTYPGVWRQKRSLLSDSFFAISIPEDAIVGSSLTTLVPRGADAAWFELMSPSTEDCPISVNRESGELKLFRTLDRESSANHRCLIKVFDRAGNYSYIVHVELTVMDINGESPSWAMDPSPYLAVVSPWAAAGSYVYRLHAVHRDTSSGGELEYFLLKGGDDRFKVDQSTGWIRTTGLPLVKNEDYLLTVQAADKRGKKSFPTVISVLAGPRRPQFKQTSYRVHIPENITPGLTLVTVSALSHQNNTLSYSLSTNPQNLFSIHQLMGEVTLTRSVDFDSGQHQFLLVVRATEIMDQLWNTVEVLVIITDVNDCIPEFQQTIYSKDNVPESVTVTTSLLQVTATDCDSGLNGEVFYLSQSPDFSISAQGVIKPTRKLDYERPSHLYEFVLLAIDRGEVPNTGTATVRIRISNENDEAPEFSQTIYRTFVAEDAGPNTLVATVHAFDPDGDRVTYEIVGGNQEGNFVIDPQKGLIRLRSSLLPLLHETEYVLYVTATDDNSSGGSQSLKSTTTVIVRVDDVNNNKPVFHKCAEYRNHAVVMENQLPGTFVLQVEATDADYGVNGQVKYGLVHREGTLPAFSIHPDTGILTTLQIFDREKQKEYSLTIKATDQAAEPLIGLCQINIRILDQNDNDPSFENNRYEYFLREDTPVGTSFLHVTAHDEDSGINATITYSVVGDEPLIFQVNSSTGWIYVNHPIPRKSLIIQDIIATDGGNRSTRVEIAVRVTDAKNQPPVWEKEIYEMVIPENTLRDTPVVTVKAISLLGDPRVTYTLEEGLVPESNMPVRFYLTVNREEGSASVLIAEPLDYETTKNFILKIRAQNVAPIPLAAFTTVYINVTDVNDNVPFFTSSIYEAAVTEGLELGTLVLQVSATDQDLGLNGEINYSILEDRTGDHAFFHIDFQTGSIYTASVFDREAKDSYLLEIKSSDGSESARPGKHGQPNSDTAYVRIFISDVNDNKPSFTQSAYYVNVDEDKEVGSIVVTVSANDQDEGMNAKIRYQITGGNVGSALDVEPDTGAIFIFQPLNYEEVKIYELILLASDGKWEDYATVTINVINKNDEAPIFSANEYHGSVMEELTVLPVAVLQVSAVDPDNVSHGSIKYSLHGNGANNIFTIDEKTGRVFAQKTLDREEHVLWRFVVLATDEDGEGLTGFADVIIYVADVNDNAPQFVCVLNNCSTHVIEHAPANTSIMDMVAIDLDDKGVESNAVVTYCIVESELNLISSDLFSINSNTGTIYTTNGNLDREKNDVHFLLVEAKDGRGLSTTGTATIRITDLNDHVPRFAQQIWNAVVLESVDVNSNIIRVSAVDEDAGENALLTFSIIEGDPDQKFYIESNGKNKWAEIKLKKKLDYENPRERWFNLTIKVEDLDFSSTSNCLIEIQDCNDHVPVFLTPFVQAEPLFENITVGTLITQVSASDADFGNNGHIVYNISPESDIRSEFHVDQDGFVTVAKSLDRETMSQYSLIILASDQGNPPKTGSATIFLNVLDINDNGPTFDGIYMPVVLENIAWPYVVPMNESSDLLYAVDPDTSENGSPFIFSLPSDYENSSEFLLTDNGNSTATLQVLRSFDREEQKEYYLPIIIADSGYPAISATNTLTITIGDANDNPHREGHKDIYVFMHGGVWSAMEIGKVFAPDEDDYDNKTYFSILKIPEHFVLNLKNGSITMANKARQGIYDLKVLVSDGIWPDVTCTVRIHVKEVKSAAIQNSVSVRLNNVTAEEFIQKDEFGLSGIDKMKNVLAEIIPTHHNNIHIFSLRNSGNRETDLKIAVHSSSAFYKPEVLQNLINDHSDKIKSKVMVEMFQTEPYFCIKTSCVNSSGCSNYEAVADSSSLVDGGSISFVSVIQNMKTICRCGAMDQVHQTCSLRPNLCLNGGTCIDSANGYRCRCLPEFLGPLCQQTKLSFNGDGYAWFPPIRHCSENHISLEFISDTPGGLLLYSGPLSKPANRNGQNFIYLEISNSVPTLKMGQETTILQLHFPKVVNVTDGKWHRIDVRIKAKEVNFMLDRCNSAVIYEAEGVGKKLLTEDRSSCEVTGLIQQDKRLWNTHPVLQLGGIKESTAHSYLHLAHKHFKGCLRNIILDKQLYDLEAPLESRNSLPCCFNNDMSCETTDWSSPPCELGTRCTGDSYVSNCACSPSHKGPECGKDVKEYFFQRDSFLHLLFPHALHTQRIFFQTLLRTRDANGIILSLTSLDKTEYIHLKVVHGLLTVSYNIGDGDFVIQLPGHRIDSGEWNMMILERMQNEFTLRLNEGGGQREITEARGMYKEIKVDPHNVILGSSKISFQGCMKDARLNNYRLPMENNTNSVVSIKSQHGVSEGCTSESCKSNPCSQPFICTDLWMMHKCSCPLGYILTDNSTGSHCIYTVCANSPCKHGTCVPRSPTEFICHCFAGYDGIKCDILHQTYDPELGFRTVFIICFCFLALTALIGGAFLWLHCRAKKKQHEGVYHVSAYNNELEDTRQNIFHYNEEGGGEEDHDAFNMTELQLSLQSSPADSLCRKTGMLNLNGPFSCNYEFCVSQKEPSQLSASKLNCSFTSGDFDRFFNDIAQDNAYIQEMLSRDSLKVYDMEGEGSPAGSLSTLASSGGDEDMVSEDMEDWGPKFGTLRKLYLYTEEDDL